MTILLLISAARYLERVKPGGALAARLEQVAGSVPGAPLGDLHLVQVDLAPPSRAAAVAVLDPLEPDDLPAPGDEVLVVHVNPGVTHAPAVEDLLRGLVERLELHHRSLSIASTMSLSASRFASNRCSSALTWSRSPRAKARSSSSVRFRSVATSSRFIRTLMVFSSHY